MTTGLTSGVEEKGELKLAEVYFKNNKNHTRTATMINILDWKGLKKEYVKMILTDLKSQLESGKHKFRFDKKGIKVL